MAPRTALEAGDPVAVDPTRDEQSFFADLLAGDVRLGKPSQDMLNRIDAYIKQGDTVLFTRPTKGQS